MVSLNKSVLEYELIPKINIISKGYKTTLKFSTIRYTFSI